MNCQEYQINISAYFDNELDEKEKAILFKHLEYCSECKNFYDAFANIDKELNILDHDKPEFQSEDEIWKAVGSCIFQKRKNTDSRTTIKFLWSIAAVLLLSLIIFAWSINLNRKQLIPWQNAPACTESENKMELQFAANMTISTLFNKRIKSNKERLEEEYAVLAVKQLLQF